MAASNIRLFVEQSLSIGDELEIEAAQLHYLKNVMRLNVGDQLYLFNGRDGEFEAAVAQCNKRNIRVALKQQSRPQIFEPDIWLIFAPIKKSRIDMIAEKATELGATKLIPVITDHTNIDRVKIDRLRANAIEAAEQCRRLTVPDISPPQSLDTLLAEWDPQRRMLVMDETAGDDASVPTMSGLGNARSGALSDAILIGPEGGFSSSELDQLAKLPFATKISLGGRILRAETAALVALALWNELVAPNIECES